MFKAGDIVVHPKYGLRAVKAITENILPDLKGPVYVLRLKRPIPGRFQLLISGEKIKKSGVRYPIGKNEVSQVFQALEDNPKNHLKVYKKEYSIIKEKVYSGNIYKIAEVIRDLEKQNHYESLRVKKDLLQSAREILIEEIMHVQCISKDKVNKLVDNALRKNKKKSR